jgi:hypothetical protein
VKDISKPLSFLFVCKTKQRKDVVKTKEGGRHGVKEKKIQKKEIRGH